MFSPSQKKKVSISSIFLTFFVDNLSWAIVFPIFAPFFLDPRNLLFSSDVSVATRTTILGFFLAIFPLGQFFGAPLIGEYADKVGRKKALITTVFFSLLGLILSALSIDLKWLWLLFLSRLTSGIFSGNLSICLAAIADLSPGENLRTRRFGYLSLLVGLSFILGAFLGGKFSDTTLNPNFHKSLPFWMAAAVCFINLLFLIFGFEETASHAPPEKFHFWEGIANIQKALSLEKLKTIYLIFFLFLFSWNILLQFIPVLAIHEFHVTSSEIGEITSFMGLCWATGSGYLVKKLLKYFTALKILEASFLSMTAVGFLFLWISNLPLLIVVLGVAVLLASMAWPLCTNKISQKAGNTMQGKVLGMSQSIQSLAMGLSPLVAASAHLHFKLPFLLASLTSLLAACLYLYKKP